MQHKFEHQIQCERFAVQSKGLVRRLGRYGNIWPGQSLTQNTRHAGTTFGVRPAASRRMNPYPLGGWKLS